LNARTGEWTSCFFDKRTRKKFIAFLERLLTVYPTGRIFIILDSATIHTAKEVQK
jgi:hypothetical protein